MPRKKLTRDLQEFEGSLHDLDYAAKLLPRLRDLPKSDFSGEIYDFRVALYAVKVAEEQAKMARNAARAIADKAWKKAVKGWTIEQLQKATGYDHED